MAVGVNKELVQVVEDESGMRLGRGLYGSNSELAKNSEKGKRQENGRSLLRSSRKSNRPPLVCA